MQMIFCLGQRQYCLYCGDVISEYFFSVDLRHWTNTCTKKEI